MAKKKRGNLFLLTTLVILTAIYGIVSYLDSKKGERSFRSEIIEYNKDKVDKFYIVPSRTPEKPVELNKKGNTWKVKLENGTEVNALGESMDQLFEQLESIKPLRIAANKEAKYAEYKVDEQGTKVQVFAAGKKVLDLILGKFDIDPNSMRGQQQFGGGQQNPKFTSYVRLANEKDVFAVDGFYEDLNGLTADVYRDKELFKSDIEAVNNIQFNYPDSAFQLVLNDKEWQINGQAVDSSKVASYLNSINRIKATEFAETPKTAITHTVNFGKTNFKAHAVGTDFVINSSDLPNDYFTAKNVFDRIFVGKSRFLGKKATTKKKKK